MNTDETGIEFSKDNYFDSILEPGFSLGALNELTKKIIGCAFAVSNTLGCGFLEKVYENALTLELRKSGLDVIQQQPVNVLYNGVVVGEYFADIMVEKVLIVEIKALSALTDAHKAQIINYLKATGLKLGLLINFGRPKVEIKRAAL